MRISILLLLFALIGCEAPLEGEEASEAKTTEAKSLNQFQNIQIRVGEQIDSEIDVKGIIANFRGETYSECLVDEINYYRHELVINENFDPHSFIWVNKVYYEDADCTIKYVFRSVTNRFVIEDNTVKVQRSYLVYANLADPQPCNLTFSLGSDAEYTLGKGTEILGLGCDLAADEQDIYLEIVDGDARLYIDSDYIQL